MSLRVVGYDELGHRITVDDGPAYARRQGHGGAAMGTYHTGIVLVHDLRAVRRKALRRQAAPRQAARKAVAG